MKMKMRSGHIVELLFVLGFVFLICCFIFGCWNKYVHGNKTMIDLSQNFKYAYIQTDGITKRIEIDTWKDWADSDSIQIIGTDGRVYYTHLNRVILSNR